MIVEYILHIKSETFKNDFFISNEYTHSTHFEDCIFKDIYFTNIDFCNCKFTNCTFNNCITKPLCKIIFDHCEFYIANFTKCFLSIHILCSAFKYINMTESKFAYTSKFSKCSYKNFNFYKCVLSNLKIDNPYDEFDVNISVDSTCNRSTLIGKIDDISKIKDNFSSSYMSFAEMYKRCGIYDKFSFCYYYSKCLKHKKLKGFEKLKSSLGLITCGYGEKPLYGILTSLILIILNSFAYMSGIKWNDKLIQYSFSFTLEGLIIPWSEFVDWLRCLYFSMTTFTTVGYGDAQAVGWLSRCCSFIQMFTGVLLMAVVAGTIFRKISR